MENIQNEFMANFYTNMMILIKSDSKVSSKLVFSTCVKQSHLVSLTHLPVGWRDWFLSQCF